MRPMFTSSQWIGRLDAGHDYHERPQGGDGLATAISQSGWKLAWNRVDRVSRARSFFLRRSAKKSEAF